MFLDADFTGFEIIDDGRGLGSLDSWLSKGLKSVEKAVKKVGKKIDEEVFQPVKKTVEEAAEDVWAEMERFGHKVEKEVIRPVVQEGLPYLKMIPGPQQPFFQVAAAAREIYVQKEQEREIEKMLNDADKLIAAAGAAQLQTDVIEPDVIEPDTLDQEVIEQVDTLAEPVWKKHPLLTGAGIGTLLFLVVRELQ